MGKTEKIIVKQGPSSIERLSCSRVSLTHIFAIFFFYRRHGRADHRDQGVTRIRPPFSQLTSLTQPLHLANGHARTSGRPPQEKARDSENIERDSRWNG